MGSIVGILSKSGPPDTRAVQRMLSAAPHRGDVLTVRVCGNAAVGIGHPADVVDAHISCPGEVVAIYSGTLDNAAALEADLTAAGSRPSSSNPADLVVAAFRSFGPDAPNRFRGVFSGIVTDGRQMWGFRDHVGFSPLFYAESPRHFVAATEVKQVLAIGGMSRDPDIDVLERIVYGRLRPDSPSAFKGVLRLPHATTLVVNGNGSATPHAYWHPRRLVESGKFSSAAEVKERFDELFEQAVRRCLTGRDVVSLSGGVDSPAVAGFAAPAHQQITGRPLPALSLVFPDHPAVDERPYIELVSGALGMPLHTMTSKAKILDDLGKWCEVLDGPIPNISAPQMQEFYLTARQLGFRNILTGDIAEVIADMPRHVAGHLFVHGRWKSLARLLETQRQQGNSLRRLQSWKNFASQLLVPFVPGGLANWYLRVRGLDFPKRVPDWLDAQKVNEVPFRNDLAFRGWSRWADLQTFPVEGCPITMEGVDICTALAGVTVRRPFGDIDLWEFFLSIPAELKYPDLKSKTLLRQLVRGRIPDQILDRRDKTYFDDHVMSQLDYTLLKRFLTKPNHRVRGVDYERLAGRLERRDLTVIDWMWMNDLVRVHAFLNLW